MGPETTSATYRRTQTHESQSFSTELLESKGTDNEHLLQTRESKKLASNTSYKVKVSLAI